MTGFEGALGKLEFEKVIHRIARYAASDPGRELLGSLRILTSLPEIVRQLKLVSECKSLISEEGDLPLHGIHAIRTSAQKAAVVGTMLLPGELLQIASTLHAVRLTRAFLAKRKETFPNLWEIADPLTGNKVLEYNIDQVIDETGAIRMDASRELRTIRHAIGDRHEQLRRRLESILRHVTDLGFSQEDIITTREGRMVIPVKSEHKNRVPGFMHSASASGATVFIEPTETLELNNEIRSLQFEEQREIERILRSLTAQVGESRDALLLNLGILSELDALSARAKYSIEILGIAPGISADGPLRIMQARHPLLLLAHGRQATVPLDLDLGDSFQTLIISGPNAGGKSVAMKCTGLLALMAQAGIHIPAADGSMLRVFRSVFVEIGDEQSIENDLSTFSSHLAHLKDIVEKADNGSLVLIDEIGSGTDPAEGSAIASSVLETLTVRKALTIATTHQGSLKVFAHATDGIENAAMEFNQETLTPTYRLRVGIPGSSYALEMAERIGFSEKVLERARLTLGEQQTKLDQLITNLEADAQRYRRDLETIEEEKSKLNNLVNEYEGKVARLSGELREMKRKAIEEAERLVSRANSMIEQSIKEIRETGGNREAVRAAREKLTALKQEVALARESVQIEPAKEEPLLLGPGVPVSLVGRTDSGEVVSVSPDGKTATVLFGIVKMRVHTSDLKRAQGTRAAAPLSGDWKAPGRSDVQTDLDLRGMTGDEALPLVDKFLDDAILAGLSQVDIIHGKGTGALRKKVTDFLATHPRVKTFRLGDWNEGGDGATIVEIAE